jgi:hypothetical protein
MNAAGGGFEVQAQALEQFARTSDTRSQELQGYVEEATGLGVGPDAFGHIPFIGSRIYQAYENHVTESVSGLTTADAMLSFISLVVRGIAAQYQAADARTTAHIDHLEHEQHLQHEQHLAYERATETENQQSGGPG